MMKRVFTVSVFCLLAVLLTGCKKVRLRSQLKALMETTIVLPDKITCVSNGEVFPMPDSLRHKPKLLVYIGPEECTTCRISHFWNYQELFELSENTDKFEMMILMADTTFVSIPLTRYLSDQDFPYPVYVDVGKNFMTDNPHIPDDARMHSFYLGGDGHPKFVGDPSSSEQMLSVFKLALNAE